jgi:hypothetical protein
MLDVRIVEGADATSVTFSATMAGLHARGDSWQRRRYIRSGFYLAGGIAVGLVNNAHGFGFDDLIPPAIGLVLAGRAVRGARGESESRDDYERKVARALDGVFGDLA